MCTVSFIGDFAKQTIPPNYPWVEPYIHPVPWTTGQTIGYPVNPPPGPTKEEFDGLKREMEALKKLLKAAQEYDTETGQPDCETDEKVAVLKKLAELVGVDLEDVLGG